MKPHAVFDISVMAAHKIYKINPLVSVRGDKALIYPQTDGGA